MNQWFDLHTHNFAYTGVRATGRGAGNDLFVGPHWQGTVPRGISKVFRAETDFVGTLTRTQPPKPAPAVNWPAWDPLKAEGIGFIGYLNALLPFMPTMPSERAMMERFARIGIGPGRPFDPDRLDPGLRAAISEGVATAAANLRSKALPQRLLVANPMEHYSIGDRTRGLKLGADGSLEIYLQHDNPGPDKVFNWLPAPAGPSVFVARLYGPSGTALTGQWQLPALQERP